MKKVIKNGQVAVLYSPGYGAGWSTWSDNKFTETLLFHPLIVEKVESGHENEITTEWLVEQFGEEYEDVYCGGAKDLKINWIDQGSRFRVNEYDGFETIILMDNDYYFIA